MVSKIEEEEREYKETQSETKSEQTRREHKEMPNFLELSQEEIEEGINNWGNEKKQLIQAENINKVFKVENLSYVKYIYIHPVM